MSELTQLQQEIEQLRHVRRVIVSALLLDASVDYKRKNKVLADSYFALKTLEKILESLDKKNENQDH